MRVKLLKWHKSCVTEPRIHDMTKRYRWKSSVRVLCLGKYHYWDDCSNWLPAMVPNVTGFTPAQGRNECGKSRGPKWGFYNVKPVLLVLKTQDLPDTFRKCAFRNPEFSCLGAPHPVVANSWNIILHRRAFQPRCHHFSTKPPCVNRLEKYPATIVSVRKNSAPPKTPRNRDSRPYPYRIVWK